MREAVESVHFCADGFGYRYSVRVRFDKTRRPVVVIESGGDRIEIDADSWPVLRDAAERGLAFVGTYPDGEATTDA